MRRLRALILALVLLPAAALAQSDIATLVADRVEVAGDDAITAEGNVEVLYGEVRLTATAVRYDRAGDRLTIDGPITLTDGESVTMVADAAELDADLRNGILTGARLVLDQQLQLASRRIDRVDGRYTQLSRTVASSCQVCPNDPVPIWEIRARRAIHDQETRQIYFEGAQFRVAGIPLAYVPVLRIPDPTVERATGFLFPSLRTTSLFGTGIRTPYFLTFGDHADLRLTPYLSAKTATLEGRYRQEFSFGRLVVDGAISTDEIEDASRAYLFARGSALLPGEFRLRYNLELVSDPSYLSDYDFSGKDRLESFLALSRTRRDEDLGFSASVFRTLRGPELAIKDEITDRLASFQYTRRIPTGDLGGDAWVTFDASALARPSTADGVGRDVARAGAALDWRNDWIIGPGLLAEANAGLTARTFLISEDSSFDPRVGQLTPHFSAGLRWPFQRIGADGAAHLVEPAAQIAWSETYGGDVPNEESLLAEFDEGNLFAISRLPGRDRAEEGLRANLGVTYTRFDPDGWSFGTTVGRVVRFDTPEQFASSSGLTGSSSDWLVAMQYRLADRFLLTNRSLFDSLDDFTRSETRLAIAIDRASISTTYTYAEADPADNRTEPTSEWELDAAVRFDRNWIGRVNWRYDTDEGKAARAGARLRYQNECLTVDLSLSRRFTSSATVTPITDFAFEVSFEGFGTGRDGRAYRRSCS